MLAFPFESAAVRYSPSPIFTVRLPSASLGRVRETTLFSKNITAYVETGYLTVLAGYLLSPSYVTAISSFPYAKLPIVISV